MRYIQSTHIHKQINVTVIKRTYTNTGSSLPKYQSIITHISPLQCGLPSASPIHATPEIAGLAYVDRL